MSLLKKLANSLTPMTPIAPGPTAQPALTRTGPMAMPAIAQPHLTTHGPLGGARRGAVTQAMAMPGGAPEGSHAVPNAFMGKSAGGSFLGNVADILGRAGKGMKSYGTGLAEGVGSRYAQPGLLDSLIGGGKNVVQRVTDPHAYGLRMQGQGHAAGLGRLIDSIKAQGGPMLAGDTYKPLKDLAAGGLTAGIPIAGMYGASKGLEHGAASLRQGASEPPVPTATPDTAQAAVKSAEDDGSGEGMRRGWQWKAMTQEANENLKNWMPRVVTTPYTPVAETLASPGKQALIKGLLGALAGGTMGYMSGPSLGGSPLTGAAVGAGIGGLSLGIHGYGQRRRENDKILDTMHHSPPGITLGEIGKKAGDAKDQKPGGDYTCPKCGCTWHTETCAHCGSMNKKAKDITYKDPKTGEHVTVDHEKLAQQVADKLYYAADDGDSRLLHNAIIERMRKHAMPSSPSGLDGGGGGEGGLGENAAMTPGAGTFADTVTSGGGGCGGKSETDLGPQATRANPSQDTNMFVAHQTQRVLDNKLGFDAEFANFCLEGALLLKQAGLEKLVKPVAATLAHEAPAASKMMPTLAHAAQPAGSTAKAMGTAASQAGAGFDLAALHPKGVQGLNAAERVAAPASLHATNAARLGEHGLEDVGKTMAGGAPQGFASKTMAGGGQSLTDQARGLWDRHGGTAGTALNTGLGAYGGYVDSDPESSTVTRLGNMGLGAAAMGLSHGNKKVNAIAGTPLGALRGRWAGELAGTGLDVGGGALGFHGGIEGYDEQGNPAYGGLGYGQALGRLGSMAGGAHGAGKQLSAVGGMGKFKGTQAGKAMENLGGHVEQFGEGAQRGVRAIPEKLLNVGKQSLGISNTPAPAIHEGLSTAGKVGLGVGGAGMLMATNPLTRHNVASTAAGEMMPQFAQQASPMIGSVLDAGQQRAQQSMESFKGQMDKYLQERGIVGPGGRVDPMHSLMESLGSHPEIMQTLGQLGGAGLGAYGMYRGNPLLTAGGLGLAGYSNPHVREFARNRMQPAFDGLQHLTERMGIGTMGHRENPLAQEHALARQTG